MKDERPVSPPSRAVRMTRRQLAKAEELASRSQPVLPSLSEPIAQESAEEIALSKQNVPEVGEDSPQQDHSLVPRIADESPEISSSYGETLEDEGVMSVPQNQAQPTPEILSPQVQLTTEELEPKTLSPEKLCEEELAPAPTPKRCQSKSPARSPMRLEESIEAIDALEEALEQVGKAIPHLNPETDKSPRKARFDARATPNTRSKGRDAETAKKPRPISLRVSRNPSALKSLKPTGNAVNNAKGRDQSGIRPSISRSASTRVASFKESEEKARTASGAAETKDYLASKRRPISLSFPAPPAPLRSSKPPTKSTFQLPGEAVAAKLKAQREERLKREEEEAAKKPTFKARPAPVRKSSAPVKQTAASKARENLLHGVKECGDDKADTASSVAQSRSSSLSSTKRHSTVLSSARPAFSTSLSSSSNSRLNVAKPGPIAKSTVSAADVATQRVKAREIFNRDRLENEQREKERREKEEAAKRARAEAAERGRIASREWAEKQRLKRMGGPAPKVATQMQAQMEPETTASA